MFSSTQLVKMAENGDGENMSILESKICQQIEVSSISSLGSGLRCSFGDTHW